MIPKHVEFVLDKHDVRVLNATRNNHLKLTCEKNGKTFKLTTSITPSCPFVLQKVEADLKRLMRERGL